MRRLAFASVYLCGYVFAQTTVGPIDSRTTAPAGQYLRSNGMNLTPSAIQRTDLPAFITVSSSAPTNPCPIAGNFWYNTSNQNYYGCPSVGANWVMITGSSGASGLGDPGANGVINRTSLNTTAPATYANIVSLFNTGLVCDGSVGLNQYLGPDGACHKPAFTPATYVVPASVGDAVTDATSTIQSTLDTIASTGNRLVFPHGTFRITKPLYSSGNFVSLEGDSNGGSAIRSTEFYGPNFFHHPDTYAGLSLSTALLTGAGSSWHLVPGDSVNLTYLNLGDALTMRSLGGLSAFTVETAIKLNSPVNSGQRSISSSVGRLRIGDSPTYAYRLFVTGTNAIQFYFTIGGVSSVITTANNVLTVGTTAHVAVSYDAAHGVTIWVNGVSKANAAITGTWTQGVFENITLGAEVIDWPDGLFGTGTLPPDAYIDSFRVSKSNRYTGAFTPPTAKFTGDANTMALLNFDSQLDSNRITQGYTKEVPAYFVVRNQGDTASGGYRLSLKIHNMQFINVGSFGPLLARSLNADVTDCLWNLYSGGAGAEFSNYSYSSTFAHNHVYGGDASPVWGLAMTYGSGLSSHVEDSYIDGGRVELVMSDASTGVSSVYLQQNPGVIYSFFSKTTTYDGVPGTITNLTTESEGADVGLIASVYVSGYGHTFVGGRLEAPGSQPSVIVDGGGQVAFHGSHFVSFAGTAPELIKILNAPSVPVVLDGAINVAALPWSLTMSSIAMTPYTTGAFATDDCVKRSASGAFVTAGIPCGPGTVTHTAGALTLHALTIGNAAADLKALASLGTGTTVLHGNATGDPTWAAVSLSSDVTGLLPAVNMVNSGVHSGDAVGPFPIVTLATVNSGPGACGDSTHVCAITTNGKGLVTAQTATAISGGGGGASQATTLTDFQLGRATTSTANDTVQFNTANSSTVVSGIRINGVSYAFPGSGKCVLSGTSNNGTVYYYFLGTNLVCGQNTSTTVTPTGTNVTVATSIAAFPAGSIPLGRWTFTANAFDASGYTDDRAFLSDRTYLAGSGLALTGSTFSLDQTFPLIGPSLQITATLFAALGTPANGTFLYCSDCTVASPCAGSGTGALAKRLNGAWVCN